MQNLPDLALRHASAYRLSKLHFNKPLSSLDRFAYVITDLASNQLYYFNYTIVDFGLDSFAMPK